MTRSSSRTPAVVDAQDRSLAAIEEEQPEAIVVWRGERIGLRALPDRIARTDDRWERDRLFGSYLEALEALNPRYEARLSGRPSPDEAASTLGLDPSGLAVDLEPLVLHTETPYYAALRRYLALIDIEQGDGTVADVWHVVRGTAWSHWFGERDLRRAVEATGRAPAETGGLEGWLAGDRMLRGPADAEGFGTAAVGAAYATLIGSPEWVEGELGLVPAEVVPFVDFVAFARVWRLRRAIGDLQYELRLAGKSDPALARVYYSGIVGHITGVHVPEQMYLVALDEHHPFAPARELAVEILATDLIAVLEARYGATWWRDDDARAMMEAIGRATSVDDALAQLGYDALDWRPVLRQIRTRLIGEMSGYGGPNITTRAGTRKV
jgi:hypothetical protein